MTKDADPSARTGRTYERQTARYIEQTGTHRSPLVDVLLPLLPAGSSILELGSGPGRDADALEQAGHTVDRTDGASAFVEYLRAAGRDARILDVMGDAFGGPYDAVFASAVLLHVPRARLSSVLRSAVDAVREGGVIAATFKKGSGEEWSTRKLEKPRHFTYWREEQLLQAFGSAGWSAVSARPAEPRLLQCLDVTCAQRRSVAGAHHQSLRERDGEGRMPTRGGSRRKGSCCRLEDD